MDNNVKNQVKEFFKAANSAQEVYVAGDKLFLSEGAAESYVRDANKVQRITRQAAEMWKEDPVIDDNKGGKNDGKNDKEE